MRSYRYRTLLLFTLHHHARKNHACCSGDSHGRHTASLLVKRSSDSKIAGFSRAWKESKERREYFDPNMKSPNTQYAIQTYIEAVPIGKPWSEIQEARHFYHICILRTKSHQSKMSFRQCGDILRTFAMIGRSRLDSLR